MNITVRTSDTRGPTRLDWLDSRHTFSFGHYYDPRHMGFGPLRVINEDKVAAGGGFAPHSHRNMEIISIVLDGTLAHKDSLGNVQTLVPGEVQRMSAGSGIQHSEFNGDKDRPVHFLQIWIMPDRENTAPGYAQTMFPLEDRRGRWLPLVNPDGSDGALSIRQDARLFGTVLDAGESLDYAAALNRKLWLQVAAGSVRVGENTLNAGDGAAIVGETAVNVSAVADGTELYLFDLVP
ncbi:pirin family protein [Chiayiivirga flava]|uniref:Pirin family protein n=1 Tax=Chiayiivirga flava TaxID=659595 RepID=A0A7W8D569_9GAMM|nr:pirin family protein [Chiayiivirga flava]MBB5208129.1 hypothetical protein [Chiayiivirga flava]